MYVLLHDRNIPFIIQSIPTVTRGQLVESFPSDHFDLSQPGLAFLPMREDLKHFLGNEPLYRQRSHYHWTPFAHDRSGRALAALILERKMLETSPP